MAQSNISGELTREIQMKTVLDVQQSLEVWKSKLQSAFILKCVIQRRYVPPFVY